MPRIKEFSEEEKTYLRENHKNKSVPQMAKHLKRAAVTVYGFMDQLGLQPRGRDNENHPFRASNRRLETFLTECKKNQVSRV